jgi:hypothetical protein
MIYGRSNARIVPLTGGRGCARVACGALLVAATFAFSSTVLARTETLRWIHPDRASVSGFRVYAGPQAGALVLVEDLGLPSVPGDGIYSYDLPNVGDQDTVFVAVSAYNSTEEAFSQVKERAPDASVPPPDPPDVPDPPDGPGGSADPASGADFELEPLGTAVAGWIDTQAPNSMAIDDSLFLVSELSGSRVLATSSQQTDIHSHYLPDDGSQWRDYEILGRFQGSSPQSRLGVTAYSAYTSQDVYYRLSTAWGSGELEVIVKPQGGGMWNCGSTGVILQPNRWYRFRFAVSDADASRTALSAKVWLEGSSEPGAWQVECEDTAPDRPTGGAVGVWAGWAGAKYWDDLAVVGLSGTPPPTPPEPPAAPDPLGAPGRPTLVSP